MIPKICFHRTSAHVASEFGNIAPQKLPIATVVNPITTLKRLYLFGVRPMKEFSYRQWVSWSKRVKRSKRSETPARHCFPKINLIRISELNSKRMLKSLSKPGFYKSILAHCVFKSTGSSIKY